MENITANQNNKPDKDVVAKYNKKHGATNAIIVIVKLMILSLKVNCLFMGIITLLYLLGVKNQITCITREIYPIYVNVFSIITFIYFWFELRIDDWIENNKSKNN